MRSRCCCSSCRTVASLCICRRWLGETLELAGSFVRAEVVRFRSSTLSLSLSRRYLGLRLTACNKAVVRNEDSFTVGASFSSKYDCSWEAASCDVGSSGNIGRRSRHSKCCVSLTRLIIRSLRCCSSLLNICSSSMTAEECESLGPWRLCSSSSDAPGAHPLYSCRDVLSE